MRILGMVTHTHDTGVALLNNGIPEIVIEEERLNRQKKTLRFPQYALAAALTQRGLSLGDVDCITMPWHIPTFWRTLTWAMLRKFPKSINLVHMRAHPPQQNELFRGTPYLAKRLREHFHVKSLPPIYGVGHHDAHAAKWFGFPSRHRAARGRFAQSKRRTGAGRLLATVHRTDISRPGTMAIRWPFRKEGEPRSPV